MTRKVREIDEQICKLIDHNGYTELIMHLELGQLSAEYLFGFYANVRGCGCDQSVSPKITLIFSKV